MEKKYLKSANFSPLLWFLGPCGGITNQYTMKLIFGIKASFMVTMNNLYSACQKKEIFLTTLHNMLYVGFILSIKVVIGSVTPIRPH